MKFKDYIGNAQQFRDLKIGLVEKENSDINELVGKVQEDFKLGTDLLKIKKQINKDLGISYHGKFKFDFCLVENTNINKLKMNKEKMKKKLFENLLVANSELAKAQTEFERKLSKI